MRLARLDRPHACGAEKIPRPTWSNTGDLGDDIVDLFASAVLLPCALELDDAS
jgi:hypothetical protein